MKVAAEGLIEALSGDGREAAIARLIIMGARAVPRLLAAFDTTSDRRQQLAILQVLEAAADPRSLGVARQAAAAGGDVAIAAIAVLRELLGGQAGPSHAEALDTLLGLARDPSADRRVRSAAVHALDGAPADVREALKGLEDLESADDALWQDAAGGRLPDDPRDLREVLGARSAAAPLDELRRLIESVVGRERSCAKEADRDAWRAVRGALHQALGLRQSRIALYDLRETLERDSGPLPASFLAALQLVGDASCLEPVAVAFSRASVGQERWQHQLAQAFHEIARRDRITSRHSAMRRALARAPGLAR